MEKFDKNKYNMQYVKEHYTQCRINLKPDEADILTEYSKITGIPKSTLYKLCLKYCYENMVDSHELTRK